MSGQSVVLVYSVGHAVRLERALKAADIARRMIPVPRDLSSDCGVCVRFETADEAGVRAVIEQLRLDFDAIVPLR